ncbi:MAG: hypothetical protein EOP84_05015 [Verrucomicrobiaceae bacterium]|nr:MAG: hypothetical protein EOP84_05015 [Verrucomicrobiaceae bacterium]
MHPYFQWLALRGVWLPVLAVALWFALAYALSLFNDEALGMLLVGMLLAVVAAHAVLFSSLCGLILIVMRRSTAPIHTALSSALGLAASLPILIAIYFNFRLL